MERSQIQSTGTQCRLLSHNTEQQPATASIAFRCGKGTGFSDLRVADSRPEVWQRASNSTSELSLNVDEI